MRGQGVIIRSEFGPSATVLSLAGRLDVASTPDARLELHRLVDHGTGPLRIDLGACTVGDSTGLGLVVEVQRRAHRRGRPVLIVTTDPRTRRLLCRVRLGRLLHALEPERPMPALDLAVEPASA